MTSRSVEPLHCPGCGREAMFTVFTSVNATLDPVLRRQLIEGSLTRFTCTACQHTADVSYPLLYHDMERQLLVWLVPEGETTPPPLGTILEECGLARFSVDGDTLRLVRSRNELVEKVRLFELGIDDRLMELFKLLVLVKLESTERLELDGIYFDDFTTHDGASLVMFALLTASGARSIGLSRQFFDDCRVRFEPFLANHPAPRGEWQEVNRTLAHALLQAMADETEGEAEG